MIMKAVLALVAGVLLVTSLQVAAQEASFRIVAKDGKFEPTSIDVPAGKPFTLEVVNQGAAAIEFESKDLKQEKVIAPGASSKINFKSLKPGTYRFVDEYREATAKGTLVAR